MEGTVTLEALLKKQQEELRGWAKDNLEPGEYVEVHLSSNTRRYQTPKKDYATHYPSAFLRESPKIVAEGELDENPFVQNAFFNSFRIMWFFRHPFTRTRINMYSDRYEITEYHDPTRVV